MGSGSRAYRQALGQLQASEEQALATMRADESSYIFDPILASQVQQIGDLNKKLNDITSQSTQITEVQQVQPVEQPAGNRKTLFLYVAIGVFAAWLLLGKK